MVMMSRYVICLSYFIQYKLKFTLCQFSRPICLGEEDDLSLNLADRNGVVAGWGTTEVDYLNTQCGYKRGIANPDSVSRKLKKLPGLRSRIFH